ncbi:SH3 domain-containing kinase-binding protein 1 isoform X2 [Ammospiza nelsoni]|uniref:SH3 domain-containing kinase-binding protein 1 isoform X2 n=1 Tax=Melospiza georgiana TaxID=44398 RepID=UPI0025AB66B7|nr:SH3 domain-containing kinase-binding protein 1 isoform X2 [Melospiza georgiana]XP_058677968.1 SH3 domain-containing kinase-binding protein 1 isoform X2 [Ammospiza caudacuta]XP_059322260.1 SH3 domain-containing kinase-binding protein 1 isoform X2 [Ammospiza nelsoni]
MVEAIVEFDYKAQHDDELTITVGDIITNIKKDDGGWWEGQLKGRRGLFPDNFVREIKKDMKKENTANKPPEKPINEVSNGSPLLLSETIIRTNKKGERSRRRRCQVAFSYMPQNEDELELKVGDIIEVVGEVEEGWWEGILNGKTGMFPSNFIKELSDSDDVGIAQEEQLKSSLKDATGSESDGGDSCSTKSEGANGGTTIQPKKVKGVGFGDIFKDKPIKLRPRSIEVENDFLPVDKSVGKKLPPATATQEPTKIEVDSRTKNKEYCKVIFPYEAQNDDELTIREGDVVTLISKDCIDVGWWEGELNGRRGVFPDNFVKLLPSDFEKERPKKPPPPSAPVIKQGSGTTDRKHEIKKIPPERPECLPNRTEEKERSEREQKQLDLQKPSVPAIPPKKPRPPKANAVSRPGTLPPRRPERPVVPVTHARSDSPKVELVGSTVSGTLEKDSSERSNDIDLEGFDSVIPIAEKLNHPTTTRPKATGRRPPSQSLTSSSLSSPDFFDSPSPEDEKEDHVSITHKTLEVSRKSRTVTISQVSDNKTSLPPKPGGLASGSNVQPSLSPSPSPGFHSIAMGTTGHRSNSPSLFGTEGKPKTEHLSQGQTALEELRTQIRELRTIIETMKDQQKKEIKQLLSELDEEKKIRLRLQMEVNDIKKALQSK